MLLYLTSYCSIFVIIIINIINNISNGTSKRVFQVYEIDIENPFCFNPTLPKKSCCRCVNINLKMSNALGLKMSFGYNINSEIMDTVPNTLLISLKI